MKTITLLLDGAGDRSYKELGYKTPLEYANTPNLDKIALQSACGLMTPLEEGVSLGTDLAHFLIFGYEMDEYPGRSIIDAIGEKIELTGHELVLRSSWAEVKSLEDGLLLQSRFTDDLTEIEIEELSESVNCEIDGYSIECIHSYDSHGLVLIKSLEGQNSITSDISDSDPFYAPQYVMKVEPFETDAIEAQIISDVVNQFLARTHKVLTGHAVNEKRMSSNKELANMVLTKWAGRLEPVEAFKNRTGMSGQIIGKSKLLAGISEFIGMEYLKYDEFSSAVELALASEADYVHLHTKAPDEASHKKDPMKKVVALEEIDKLIEPLLEFEGLLIVTADHSTPCSGKMIHSGESVPFMARGEFVRRDRVSAFSEVDCISGGLRLNGHNFMKYVQNATDRGNLYHLRAGKLRRNYKPVEVNRLILKDRVNKK